MFSVLNYNVQLCVVDWTEIIVNFYQGGLT